ncbi:MAG: tRNA (5-methylaminomethyl-2-thiouridine)(34)-methyltransferase MnmD [Pseudomonadota bacterium]
MAGQGPKIAWRDGVPISQRFDDPYYSLGGGLAEARHVFLAGNDLPARFRPGFHIGEIGFGTGLNCLAALIAWRQSGTAGALRFTSFEAFPLEPSEIRQALGVFDEVAPLIDPFLACLSGAPGALPDLDLTLIGGDARARVPEWDDEADAWFLDGFSPAKNPELWDPSLLAAVGRKTRPGGSAATYSAAGHVRRALTEAGFEVTRAPGYGHKRHMTRALLR